MALGFSLLLSVLNVYFRDMEFIWQVIVHAGFFLSPILYDLNMFPDNIRTILQLNPMAAILNAARDLVLYDRLPTLYATLYIIGTTAAIFVAGYVVFRIKDKKLVEHL